MKFPFKLLLLICFYFNSNAQVQEISLDSCLIWFRQFYPIAQQIRLQNKSEQIQLSTAHKSWWPQLSFTGQTTYQSDVTAIEIPIPNIPLPAPLDKDQYKFYGEINQLLFDGFSIRRQKNALQLTSQIETTKSEIEFYKAETKLLSLFFTALVLKEQQKIQISILSDLDAQITRLQSGVEEGITLESSLQALLAEQLINQQKSDELESKLQYIQKALAAFTGVAFAEEARFIQPMLPQPRKLILRKEIRLSELYTQQAEAQWKLKQSQGIPKILLFGQAGYSNPALNFLKNGFESYYIAGLRFTWNISPAYSFSNDKEQMRIGKNMAALQKELFLIHNQQAIDEQTLEISRLEKIIDTDQKILEYRTQIKAASLAQLNEGSITSADYIRELNAEERAKSNAALHRIQLLQAHYILNYLYGN
ncbi:MAG: TolC family protein [Saprospiraceae bacterium]|nr:TolC family protein [Saprospiraceae bacterium]